MKRMGIATWRRLLWVLLAGLASITACTLGAGPDLPSITERGDTSASTTGTTATTGSTFSPTGDGDGDGPIAGGSGGHTGTGGRADYGGEGGLGGASPVNSLAAGGSP